MPPYALPFSTALTALDRLFADYLGLRGSTRLRFCFTFAPLRLCVRFSPSLCPLGLRLPFDDVDAIQALNQLFHYSLQ